MIKVTRLNNETAHAVKIQWSGNSKQLAAGEHHSFEEGGFVLPDSPGSFVIEILADDIANPTAAVYTMGSFIRVHYPSSDGGMYVRSTLPGQLVVLSACVLISADNTRSGIVIGDWEVAPHQ